MGKKFLQGMDANVKLWSGVVTVFAKSGNYVAQLDDVELDPVDLAFRIVIDGDLRDQVRRSAVVLASAGREQAEVADVCFDEGVPCAYVTELSLSTRLQIVFAKTRNPLLKARRALWEWRTERRMLRALARSAGAQCNGTPTYRNYRQRTQDTILFFDSRSSIESMATDDQIESRAAEMLSGGPLRLVFSGRLVAIKGADHLIAVARHLTLRGFNFTLKIAGDGHLKDEILRNVGTMPIELLGVLEFQTQLTPLLRSSCDLFVCCHRQGDPSCTYLETMAAGVAIVGYDNEAFRGLAELSGSGWIVSKDRPDLLAEAITRITREEIKDASFRARNFAREHSMEAEFARRIEHLQRLSRSS